MNTTNTFITVPEIQEVLSVSESKAYRIVRKLNEELKQKGIYLLNLMSSPGSGKTTTLRSTIAALKDELRIGVMEADIDSDVDAKAIAAAGDEGQRGAAAGEALPQIDQPPGGFRAGGEG